MPVLSRTFIPTNYAGGPGTAASKSRIQSFVLFGVRVLGVKRSGVGQNLSSVILVPGNQEYSYVPSGIIRLDPNVQFEPGETVWVLWED